MCLKYSESRSQHGFVISREFFPENLLFTKKERKINCCPLQHAPPGPDPASNMNVRNDDDSREIKPA